MPDLSSSILQISIWALPTIFAIILHEVSHGVVALQLGDDTAQRAGRLTLNPIPHIDPIGTIILPALLILTHLPVFGYARPVPVDFRRLRNGRTGMMEVAAAGPLTNFALAFASALGLRFLSGMVYGPLADDVVIPLANMFRASVLVNVMLGIFNLVPLLPLDGGRVMVGLLPLAAARAYAQTERFGFMILVLLLWMGWLNVIINPSIAFALRVIQRVVL